MSLPHDFDCIRDSGLITVFILGSGFSANYVPQLKDLYYTKKEHVERLLNCSPIDIDESNPDAFYLWCEHILQQISEVDSMPAKLRLSEALGLLTDQRWTGEIGLPIRGTTPRHRVTARLIKEGCLDIVWSLNWDTLLEDALEKIGFQKGVPKKRQPWRNSYLVTITNKEIRENARSDVVQILKPHGCVLALKEARKYYDNEDVDSAQELANRLKITFSDLNKSDQDSKAIQPDETDVAFQRKLKDCVRTYPLVVVGWSISEPYLKDALIAAATDDRTTNRIGNLTIIDPEFNDNGHTLVTSAYNLSPENVHITVSRNKQGLTTNLLFLWIQTQYVFDVLFEIADKKAQIIIEELRETIKDPVETNSLYSWVDSYLPVWNQLCWRGGIVSCQDFNPSCVHLNERDHYVPLDITKSDRIDLRVAALLLTETFCETNKWDFEEFPGGYWSPNQGRLVLPLPAWGQLNHLHALNSLANAIHKKPGRINSIDIYPIDDCGNRLNEDSRIVWNLRANVAELMPVASRSTADQIGLASSLQYMEEQVHA